MCPLLKPQIYTQNQFFFLDNETVNEAYFLIKGKAAFVLPRYRNVPYIRIIEGNHFGIIDIVGSCQIHNIEITEWYKKKSLLTRQFTVQSKTQCEVLILSIQHLFQMEQEFNDCFDDLF